MGESCGLQAATLQPSESEKSEEKKGKTPRSIIQRAGVEQDQESLDKGMGSGASPRFWIKVWAGAGPRASPSLWIRIWACTRFGISCSFQNPKLQWGREPTEPTASG